MTMCSILLFKNYIRRLFQWPRTNIVCVLALNEIELLYFSSSSGYVGMAPFWVQTYALT